MRTFRAFVILAASMIALPALATTYTVRPDGTGDFPNIQAAIENCVNGDIVQLADGTFQGAGNRDLDFGGRAITVRSLSGTPEACTIDCQGGAYRGFYFHTAEGPTSIVEGITIANGSVYGAAVKMDSASPLLSHCIFRDSSAPAVVYLGSTVPQVQDCTFLRNAQGLYRDWPGGTGVYTRCIFRENAGEMGAAVRTSSAATDRFVDCQFLDNTASFAGGAVYKDNDGHAYFVGCLFVGNHCDGPGGALQDANEGLVTLDTCTLDGNTTNTIGSAIGIGPYSTAIITNTVIAFSPKGAAVVCQGYLAEASVSCSDIYGNVDGDWTSCIRTQQAENGNFSADPLFCDPAAGDYRISGNSPCHPDQQPTCGQVGAFGIGCAIDHLVLNADGSGDAPTIQAAIDLVPEGALIDLTDGTYTGTGNRDIDFRGKAVQLRSQSGDPERCIIDCGGPAEAHRGFVFQTGEGVESVVQGITVTNAIAESGGAFLLDGASPRISDCRILRNSAVGGAGILCRNGAVPIIEGCLFAENTAGVRGAGIECRDTAAPVLRRLTFVMNSAPQGAGIAHQGSSILQARQLIIAMSPAGDAVACTGTGSVSADCCDIIGNAGGDWTGCLEGQQGTNGNLSSDPLFCGSADLDFGLQAISPCAPAQSGACEGIGAYGVGCGHVFLVRADGSGEAPTIQAAIAAAADSDIVELADGIYRGPGNRDLTIGPKVVTIRSQSHDPLTCTIDCQGSSTDPHRGFSLISGETERVVIQGITITNGWAHTLSDQDPGEGGAIRIGYRDTGLPPSYPTIRDCRFVSNHGEYQGGAVSVVYDGPGTTISDCVFSGNWAPQGGAYFGAQCGTALTGCTFEDNHASRGAAAYLGYPGAEAFRSCTFVRNIASDSGGGILVPAGSLGGPLVDHCTFAENSAHFGGGIRLTGHTHSVLSSTIIAFSADGGALMADLPDHTPTTCCDFYGNTDGDWTGGFEGRVGVDGNQSADPLFCGGLDPEEPWAIAGSSPCAPAQNADCGLVGAWPVGCESSVAVPDREAPAGALWLGSSAPNPFLHEAQIRFALPSSGAVSVAVYDAAGRLVRTLANGQMEAGVHVVVWNGRTGDGAAASSGVYYCRLRSNGQERTGTLVRIR